MWWAAVRYACLKFNISLSFIIHSLICRHHDTNESVPEVALRCRGPVLENVYAESYTHSYHVCHPGWIYSLFFNLCDTFLFYVWRNEFCNVLTYQSYRVYTAVKLNIPVPECLSVDNAHVERVCSWDMSLVRAATAGQSVVGRMLLVTASLAVNRCIPTPLAPESIVTHYSLLQFNEQNRKCIGHKTLFPQSAKRGICCIEVLSVCLPIRLSLVIIYAPLRRMFFQF